MNCSQLPGWQLRCGKKEMKNLWSNMKSQLSVLNSFLASYTKAKIKCKDLKDEFFF
jgi:hypothetical protein